MAKRFLPHLLFMQILRHLLEKVDTCLPNDNNSYTHKYLKHTDCGYAYTVVCTDDQYTSDVKFYRRPDAAKKFLEAIWEEYSEIQNIIQENFKPKYNEEIEAEHRKTISIKECCICGEEMKYKRKIEKGTFSHVSVPEVSQTQLKIGQIFSIVIKIPIMRNNTCFRPFFTSTRQRV